MRDGSSVASRQEAGDDGETTTSASVGLAGFLRLGGREEQDDTERRGGRPNEFDRWLVRQIAVKVGQPDVAMALWDLEDAYRPTGECHGRIVFRDRGALLSVIISPELGFGDAFSAGRDRGRGRSRRCARALLPVHGSRRRGGGQTHRTRPTAETALQYQDRIAATHSSPLRLGQRLLPPVARRGDGLHVCVLRHAGGHAWNRHSGPSSTMSAAS